MIIHYEGNSKHIVYFDSGETIVLDENMLSELEAHFNKKLSAAERKSEKKFKQKTFFQEINAEKNK